MSDSESEIEQQESGSEVVSDVEENDSDNSDAEEGSDQKLEDESDDSDDECDDDEEVPKLVKIEDDEKSKKDQKKKNKKESSPVKVKEESSEDILKKYEELKGKQLFLRFPVKLPKKPEEVEEFVKKYCEKIIKVHRPRQKSVRHCLVEFVSEADRNKAKKELSKVEIEGSKIIIQMPKHEDDEYIKKIVNLRKKKLEKLFEKKQAKKLGKEKDNSSFTSTLSIENIPSSATAADIKALFSNAVELRFTVAKGIEDTAKAIVTLPSTKDATTAKRTKLKIGENNLIIKFATKSGHEKKKKNKKNKKKSDNVNKPQKGNKQKPNNKRKLPQDGKSEEDQASPSKKQKKKKNKPSKVAVNGEATNKNENKKNKNKQKNNQNNNSNNQVKKNKNKNNEQQNAKNKQTKDVKSENDVSANKKIKKEKKKAVAAN